MGGERFSYQATKDGVVRVFWESRCVMALGGRRGDVLRTELAAADDEKVQAALRRVTGNFRRGNERRDKR